MLLTGRSGAGTVLEQGTELVIVSVIFLAFERACDHMTSPGQLLLRQLGDGPLHDRASLERLLAGAIFGTRLTYLISGAKADLDDQAECLQSAEYLLRHAARADLRLTVNYDDRRRPGWERTHRAVDLPLLSFDLVPPLHAAVGRQEPQAVILFLRLGARLDFVPVAGGSALHAPLSHLCHQLNAEAEEHALTELAED
ncbi:uncharacterized protein LOC119114010 [Pollicipes pollicipes]|uniref:uncharacterized protein LOC119114010 n=1 Tax=Pollicipes pollicipes TaxID=41117 RepID=UPI00188533BB|nr:uncharacterized protein LOC119114010 [Pollicipes pollicipes]